MISGIGWYFGGPFAAAACFLVGGILILIGLRAKDKEKSTNQRVILDDKEQPYVRALRIKAWHKWGLVGFVCIGIVVGVWWYLTVNANPTSTFIVAKVLFQGINHPDNCQTPPQLIQATPAPKFYENEPLSANICFAIAGVQDRIAKDALWSVEGHITPIYTEEDSQKGLRQEQRLFHDFKDRTFKDWHDNEIKGKTFVGPEGPWITGGFGNLSKAEADGLNSGSLVIAYFSYARWTDNNGRRFERDMCSYVQPPKLSAVGFPIFRNCYDQYEVRGVWPPWD
jgi:hypothetical protein